MPHIFPSMNVSRRVVYIGILMDGETYDILFGLGMKEVRLWSKQCLYLIDTVTTYNDKQLKLLHKNWHFSKNCFSPPVMQGSDVRVWSAVYIPRVHMHVSWYTLRPFDHSNTVY